MRKIKEKYLQELTSLKHGDFWVARLSFGQGNPISSYIVHIDNFKDGVVDFTPFIAGEFIQYRSSQMHYFQLLKKIMNWEGVLSV